MSKDAAEYIDWYKNIWLTQGANAGRAFSSWVADREMEAILEERERIVKILFKEAEGDYRKLMLTPQLLALIEKD